MSSVANKLSKELKNMKKSKGIYAVISSPQDYREIVDSAVNILTRNQKMEGIYVTLNMNSDVLLDKFKKEGADVSKLVLIDATGEKITNKQSVALDNPKSLTALSLTIGETAQKHKFDFIFIDSLSTLLTYNSVEATEKFVHFMLLKILI